MTKIYDVFGLRLRIMYSAFSAIRESPGGVRGGRRQWPNRRFLHRGAKRALVLKAINENQVKIYTYGPLIHNPQVLELLRERGISILNPGEEEPPGLIVIRDPRHPAPGAAHPGAGGAHIIDAHLSPGGQCPGHHPALGRQGFATLTAGPPTTRRCGVSWAIPTAGGHVVSSSVDVADLPVAPISS